MTQDNEFKVIETQEQLNSVIKSRVDREREKYTDEINQLKAKNDELIKQVTDLTNKVSQSDSKIEEMTGQIKEKDDKIQGFEIDQMRDEIAYQYGIPRDFSSRLKGANQEEIEADAKAMAKTLENMRPSPPTKSNEPENILSGIDASYAKMAESLTQGE